MYIILACLITVSAFTYLSHVLASSGLSQDLKPCIFICAFASSALVLAVGCDFVLKKRNRRLENELLKGVIGFSGAPKSVSELSKVGNWNACLNELIRMLSELSERERLIADYSSDISICLGTEMQILAINPAVRKHWSLEPAIIVGKPFTALINPCLLPSFVERFVNIGLLKTTDTLETQIVTGMNSIVDVELTVDYSKTDNLFFLVASDISARKAVERLRAQLFSMLGHDLRVPLTAVQFAISLLLKDTALSDSGRSVLLEAQYSVSRAINLSSDMLDMQQAEEGALKLKKQQVFVKELVSLTCAEFQSQAAAAKQTFELEISDEFSVLADEDRLKQVIANLISNAIKYGESGIIKIDARLLDGATVELSVHNSGKPIRDQDKALLFQPYGQTLNAASAVRSSGLGLALCRTLLLAMSGSISVKDSNQLSGTCFSLSLPIFFSD